MSRESVLAAAGLPSPGGTEAVRAVVRQGLARWLPDARSGWLASPPAIGTRVPTAVHRLLEVSGPLSFGPLRHAWRRQDRLKGSVPFPESDAVLHAWFAAFDEFLLLNDRVSIRAPGLVGLDPIAQILTDALAPHPEGLTRAALRAECLALGMAPGTFATALTYSPLVTPAARDLWVLTSENAREVGRRRSQSRGRRTRRVTYSWTAEGELALSAFVPSLESPVVHVPKEVAHLLEGKRFDAFDALGVKDGVAIKAGTVWGFAPFLSRAKAASGDVIQLRFDLLARTVALRLARSRDGASTEVTEP